MFQAATTSMRQVEGVMGVTVVREENQRKVGVVRAGWGGGEVGERTEFESSETGRDDRIVGV